MIPFPLPVPSTSESLAWGAPCSIGNRTYSVPVLGVAGKAAKVRWCLGQGLSSVLAGGKMRSRERMKPLDQVVFERKVGGRVARGNIELIIDGTQVSIDRARTDDQRFRNLGVGEPACYQAQHLDLPFGQIARSGWRRQLVMCASSTPRGLRRRLTGEGGVLHRCQRLLRRHRLPLGPRCCERLLAECGTFGGKSACHKGTLFRWEGRSKLGTQRFGGTPPPCGRRRLPLRRECHTDPLQISGDAPILVDFAQNRHAFLEQPTCRRHVALRER